MKNYTDNMPSYFVGWLKDMGYSVDISDEEIERRRVLEEKKEEPKTPPTPPNIIPEEEDKGDEKK